VPQKARILLVDDRAENLIALEAILSSLNQQLVPVRSGEAALKALLAEEFAVILLDVVMPGMDGFETAAHITRRARTHDVPIIFLTAAGAEPDHAFRGYAAGAVDYIAKPFDPWVLRAKVAARKSLRTRACPRKSWSKDLIIAVTVRLITMIASNPTSDAPEACRLRVVRAELGPRPPATTTAPPRSHQ